MPEEQQPAAEEVTDEQQPDPGWDEFDRRLKGHLDAFKADLITKDALGAELDNYFGGLAPEGGDGAAEPNTGGAAAGNGSGPGPDAGPGPGDGAGSAVTAKAASARTEGGGVLTFLLGKPARK